ncbi:17423_t:CDS:2 [Acaulospora morrowiae]|uniref:17423_t:CDS:1 n=1 Tax=Acaulospora morrowiae TaxID=94023 RepID=A0A9N9GK35_9GLOM|nr:17423_t:CDS:2 [Acaulospora morrowiae]
MTRYSLTLNISSMEEPNNKSISTKKRIFRWKPKEESGLLKIVKREKECAEREVRKVNWKVIQNEFNTKFRSNRNVKSLQEKYKDYLRDEVYLSASEGKRRTYPFTDEHIKLILSAKIKELGGRPWKFLSDEINNRLSPSAIKCTPNQVKNKYYTEREKLERIAKGVLIHMPTEEYKTSNEIMNIANLLNYEK